MPSPTVAQRHKLSTDPISDAHVILLEFQEDTKSTVHYAAINNADVVHLTNTYIGTDISLSLPSSGSSHPTVRLEMSNITRVISPILFRAKNRIGCRLKLIDVSDPDVSIIDTIDMYVLSGVTGDSIKVSADLMVRASLQEPVPNRRTSKLFFPGVWWTT